MSRRAPTLEDVAREAGVSRATVSRVVNGVQSVDPALQDAVRQAVERTGYAPNRAARSLVTRRTETVALIVSGAGDMSGEERNAFTARVPADPFFGRVVTGVVDYLRPRSMHPLLMFADSAQSRQQALNDLRQGSADGALGPVVTFPSSARRAGPAASGACSRRAGHRPSYWMYSGLCPVRRRGSLPVRAKPRTWGRVHDVAGQTGI
ncbi:LacI family DNA-binding transcriptional regulator [Streptomyces mirabilis]|uniref:LacI family DNA-binding transcriptional regulator n=1 Tax=Streptomyces mirabilis TaxID=68239 RepID=UPI0036D9BCBF